MKYFSIGFGASGEQQNVTDKLKSAGFEAIQISSGLLVKTPDETNDIKKILDPIPTGITISPIDQKSVLNDPEFSKDAKLFVS